MEIKNLIDYLNQIKKHLKSTKEPVTFITEPIDEIIKKLKILEELKKSLSPGGVIEIDYYKDEPLPDMSGIRFVNDWLNKLEEKYFPKVKKTITIETKDKETMDGVIKLFKSDITVFEGTNIKEHD